MKKEKIEEFISSTVVHELIENNLDLLDFLRSRRDIIVSRNSLDALTVIFRDIRAFFCNNLILPFCKFFVTSIS